MNKPLVSVLICTYNAEKTIIPTLDSCVNQTYENCEILILDNGSKDKTKDLIKDYQKEHENVKLYDEWKNLWAYNGLNYLMDRSNWKYIAIQDHDDIWHSKKIEEQVNFLEKNEEYVGCLTWTLIYYWISKIWYLHSTKWWPTNLWMHTSLMFRSDWFRYNTSNTYLCDSYFMSKILSQNSKRLWIIPDVLSLHYMKETWENFSDFWFSPTLKNIRRYFDVYWFTVYDTCLFIYQIMLWLIKPISKKAKKWIDKFLIIHLRWAKSKSDLESGNPYVKQLLSYFP